MEIFIIVLFVIIILISIYMIVSYRRQVKDICRQVQFMRKHDTNMQAASDIISSKDIVALTDEINRLNEEAKEKIAEYGRRDRLLRETITSLSHDIRTPLTSVNGYIQLLSETDDEEEKKRYMEIILDRIGNLKDIFEDLFTYTRLQENAYRLDMEKENLTGIVFESVVGFYEAFEKEKIDVRVDLAEEDMYAVLNRTAAGRVYQNIIKNSLVHCKDCVEISFAAHDGEAVFLCRNQIKDDDIIDVDRIFDRFYKADTARSLNSTGLGLAIAKRLTEEMNGTVSASVTDGVFEIKVSFKVIA